MATKSRSRRKTTSNQVSFDAEPERKGSATPDVDPRSSDEHTDLYRKRSWRWFMVLAVVYFCWLGWLAYAAWVNVQAGNQ